MQETRTLNAEVGAEEIGRRLAGCTPPSPKVTKGCLAHFAKYATSADKGAYLE